MGAFCEEAIGCAIHGLLEENEELRKKALFMEEAINEKEREIEYFCIRLLLREQPVARDLRQITTAQKMIIDMERIGDQAADIAEISSFTVGSRVKSSVHIADMAVAAVKMLTDSVDSFVEEDVEKANKVVESDDKVDDLFDKVKAELLEMILEDSTTGGECLDLLMVAKYLERIGDHAVNIAEAVVYSITGM
jgi:phosphate transport system protein